MRELSRDSGRTQLEERSVSGEPGKRHALHQGGMPERDYSRERNSTAAMKRLAWRALVGTISGGVMMVVGTLAETHNRHAQITLDWHLMLLGAGLVLFAWGCVNLGVYRGRAGFVVVGLYAFVVSAVVSLVICVPPLLAPAAFSSMMTVFAFLPVVVVLLLPGKPWHRHLHRRP